MRIPRLEALDIAPMNGNLISTLSPSFSTSALGKVAIVILGTLLLTLSAKVHVPFWPVPMTMQTFVVLVMAMACGSWIGGSIMLAYLVEGALGLPVFSGTPERAAGLVYMAGPTGGYLAGMLAASLIVGRLSARGWDRSPSTTLLAMLIGTFVIFGLGYAWLAVLIGPAKAWTFGVVPFVLSEALKIALATLVLPASWRLLERK
ncbi:MAG TPA: biotin transporter BioY [Bauldia sp.]|jgi:biotin transport system substrate-specific component|nr:biotin transporter BioY [Bauldia sp.]